AVGARLLFPDDRIQHVGMVLGVNNGAAHVYHEYPASTVGYNAFTHLIRNYSAITAACMATRRDVIEKVGGFDEQFATDFNDTDFCLRVCRHGFKILGGCDGKLAPNLMTPAFFWRLSSTDSESFIPLTPSCTISRAYRTNG